MPGVPVTPDPDRRPPAAAPGDELGHVARRPPRRAARPACSARSSRSPSARSSGSTFATGDPQLPAGAAPGRSAAVLPGLGDAFVDPAQDRDRRSGSSSRCRCCSTRCWAFIVARPDPAERRAVRPWIPLALFFFALGVGDRLARPAVRRRVPAQLHRRRPQSLNIAAGPVLRLRDDDVPGLRAGHGVPDPAGRPVARRHPDLGAAALVAAVS